MAKDILKITFDADTKQFEQNLLGSMNNISNVAADRLGKAFEEAGRKPKLKKQLTGVYQNLFDELTDASGNIDKVNEAIDRFIGRIDYINSFENKKINGKKIPGIFDNLSIGDVDKILEGYDKIVEKEKQLSTISSDEYRNKIREKSTVKSLKTLEKTYQSTEESRAKYEEKVKGYLKNNGLQTSAISEEIKAYSSLIALFDKINNTKVDYGSAEAVKKSQSLLYVMKQIEEFESKNGGALFSSFRKNELGDIKNITSSIAELSVNGVEGSITNFIKKMTNPIKDEIEQINQSAIKNLLKMSKHNAKSAETTQSKVNDAINSSNNAVNSISGKNGFNESPDGINVWEKSLENLKEEFKDVIKYAVDAETALSKINELTKNAETKGLNVSQQKDLIGYSRRFLEVNKDDNLMIKDESWDFIEQWQKKYESVGKNVTKMTEKQLVEIEKLKTAQKDVVPATVPGQTGNIDDSKVIKLREDLEQTKKDITSLKGRVDTLENTTAFDTLSSKVEDFDKKIKTIDGSVGNLSNSFQLLSELSLTDLQKVVIPFFNGINQVYQENNGKKISGYWDELKKEIDGNNSSLREHLKLVGLYNSEQNGVRLVDSGLVKSGGLIGDSTTLLATKNRDSRFEDAQLLKLKLEEAYAAGVNVSRILDIIGTKESNVFLEIQETAKGKILGDTYSQNPWVNPDIYKATDEQIQKLIFDLIKLNELGIGVDTNLTNIFYDQKKGFSFIDLDLKPAKFGSYGEMVNEFIDTTIGEAEIHYEEKGDKTNLAITNKLRERFANLSKQVIQAYAEAQDSHSPSKEFERLENDAVDGIIVGANKNADKLKNVGRQMAENIKHGFKEGMSELNDIVSNIAIGNQTIKDDKIDKNIGHYNRMIDLMKKYVTLQEEINKGNYKILYKNEDGQYWNVDANDTTKESKYIKPTKVSIKRQLDRYLSYKNDDKMSKYADIEKEKLASYVAAFNNADEAQKIFGNKNKEIFTEVLGMIDKANASMKAYNESQSVFSGMLYNAYNLTDKTSWTLAERDSFEKILNTGDIEKAVGFLKEHLGIQIPQAANQAKTAIDGIGEKVKQEGQETKVLKITIPLDADINSLNTSIQEKKDQIKPVEVQLTATTQTPAVTMDTNVGTTGMAYESEQANLLKGSIDKITASVDAKTSAFRQEEQVVVGTVQREITNLEALDGQLIIIKETLEKLSKIPVKLDVKLLDNNIDENTQRIIEGLKNSINELNPEILSGLKSTLKALSIDTSVAENVQKLANAFLNLKVNLNNVSTGGMEFLNSIKELSNSGRAIENLVKVINTTEEKLAKAKQAVKETSDTSTASTKKDIKKENQEIVLPSNSKEWEAIYEKAEKYKNVLGEIQKITYSMRHDKDGKELRSYKVTGSKSSITLGENLRVVGQKETQEYQKTTQDSYNKEIKLLERINRLKIQNLNPNNKNYEQNQARISNLEKELSLLRKIREENNLYSNSGETLVKAANNNFSKMYSAAQSDQNKNTQSKDINVLLKNQKDEYDAIYQAKLKIAQLDKSSVTYSIDKQKLEEEVKAHQKSYLLIQKKLAGYLSEEQNQERINNLLKIGAEYQDRIYITRSSKLETNLDAQITSRKKIYDLQAKIATSSNEATKAGYKADLKAELEKLKVLREQATQYTDILSKAEQEAYVAENTKNALQKRKDIIGASQNASSQNQTVKSSNISARIAKTASDMEQLKQLNSSDAFADVFVNAESKVADLNSRLEQGKISLSQYGAEFSKIKSDLNKNKNIYATIEPNDLAKAKQEMAEYASIVSDGQAVFKKGVESGEEVTYTWTDQNGIVNNLKLSYDEATGSLSKFHTQQKQTIKPAKTFAQTLVQSWKNVARYAMTFMSFYRVISIIRKGINYIKELDTALTEMRKVSDETVSSLKQFQETSFDIASAIGTTASQIQNSVADFMRLGESIEEATKSAQAANILLNVSEFESIDEATKSLTAMAAAYDELTDMEIVDKLNEVGNNFAISTDGLATALQKSASALNTAGNNMNESIALVTAGNQVVQDPDSVGAGIRTIALRITGTKEAKEELEDLGEDTEDFVVQTASKMQDKIKTFTKVASNNYKGFDILDDNGNYKSTYEILLGIAEIYEEIVETDKKFGSNMANGLLETLAGKNRSNIAASILQSPDILKEAYVSSSEESANSAQDELNKYLDSIAGKISQFTNEVQEFWYNLISSETVKMFVDAGTKIVDILGDIVDVLGEVGTIAAIFGAAFGIHKVKNFGGGRAKKFALKNKYATESFNREVSEFWCPLEW